MDWDDVKEIAVIVGVVFVFVVVIVGLILIPVYYQSCRKAEITNSSQGTAYSCGDFFWAGDTITDISEGKKIRLKGE